jgi:hypothetical protein
MQNTDGKFLKKRKLFAKTILGTNIPRKNFCKNVNFREHFREKENVRKSEQANFRLFSLFAKMKKGVFVSTLVPHQNFCPEPKPGGWTLFLFSEDEFRMMSIIKAIPKAPDRNFDFWNNIGTSLISKACKPLRDSPTQKCVRL